jgi:hypothetical protein
MAFFATTEDLPFARAQWNPRNRNRNTPKDVNPPIQPPKAPKTVPSRTSKGCPSGQKYVKRLVYGFERMVCTVSGPGIPYAYRSLIDTNDQLRGIKKPRRIPNAVLRDRKPTRRTKRGYHQAKSSSYVRENIEDN